MHTILLGVVGRIYKGHTDTPLSRLVWTTVKSRKSHTNYITTPSNMQQKLSAQALKAEAILYFRDKPEDRGKFVSKPS